MKQIKHFQVIRLQYSSRGNYECHYLSHTVTHSTLDKKVEECDSQDLTSEEDKDHLVTAIKHGDTCQVSQMLSAGGVNHNTCYELADRGGLSPLMIACMYGQHAIAELLLEHGAKVNLQDSLGWSALMHAIKPGHLAVAQLLLHHGADVDLQSTKWESALSLALHQEDPVMVTVIDEKVSSVY